MLWMQAVCRKMKRLGLDMSSILASNPVAVCEVSRIGSKIIILINEEFRTENVYYFLIDDSCK